MEFGIIKKSISGYDVLITDMERTVCDAVKYRNKIGLDVCGEVIDNYLKKENRNISLLHEYAQKLRVKIYCLHIWRQDYDKEYRKVH